MKHIDLLKGRYSVRNFKPDAVSSEDLRLILDAAMYSPTAGNKQPQRLLVINAEESIEKLKECTKCHFGAPTAILVCYDKSDDWVRPYDQKTSGDIDASIITTNMMNQAWELGVGTTWVMHFDPVKMKNAFNVPDTYEMTALLVMGYPSEDATINPLHDKFDDEENLVFYNKF